MTQKKLTVRVTQQEYEQILKQADASNLSTNRYLLQCALQASHGDEKKLSRLMGQLCILQNHLQTQTGETLRQALYDWRLETIRLLEA